MADAFSPIPEDFTADPIDTAILKKCAEDFMRRALEQLNAGNYAAVERSLLAASGVVMGITFAQLHQLNGSAA